MKKTITLLMVISIMFISIIYDYADAITSEKLAEITSAHEHTRNWMNDNGYDFELYGATTSDLTPISDYLTLLSDNGIFIDLPELNIYQYEDREWIYSEISDKFYLTYIIYKDGSGYTMKMEVPTSYRPRNEALTYLIVSVLGIDYEEANELLESLQYNVIDHISSIKTESYDINYTESNSFWALGVFASK